MTRYFLFAFRRIKTILMSPSVTLQYPFVKRSLPVASRSQLRLEIEECTGCNVCVEVCPVEAIAIDSREFTDELVIPTSSDGHIFKKNVLQIEVDYGKCTFCGECVSLCEPGAMQYERKMLEVSPYRESLKKKLITSKKIPSSLRRNI